jgi:putative pyruvate formate lyase activating enzyme
VRHLVLPDGIAGTEEIMRFLAEEISTETYINVMDQYRPCFKAERSPGVERALMTVEFDQAVAIAERYGLRRLDHLTAVSRLARVL